MIVALYARYSSDNQRTESIVAQLRACREYCQRYGYTIIKEYADEAMTCLLYTSPSPRDRQKSRMPSSA